MCDTFGTEPLNVLVIGSGAREHALVWKLRQSSGLADLFAAPGNPGTAQLGTNLDIDPADQEAIVRACRGQKIGLVVVGNEAPLEAGLVDRLHVEGIPVFGPSKAAAQIEWSKAFAKRLMADHGIPTASFRAFSDVSAACEFVEEHDGRLVIKPDGLTLGKGVVVTSTQEEALRAVRSAMEDRAFGASGATVVIEERLSGREVSAHAFSDGTTVRHMPFSCDHKPVYDGDRGPNTGGIGAYSPAEWLDLATATEIEVNVTEAALAAMASEGRPYRGVLYPGVMVTEEGPRVIEFNSRFGDPETQVLLPRLESDLLDVLWATANNTLHEIDVAWSGHACVAVALASGGYPGPYEKGFPIQGIENLDEDILAFHAGTAKSASGELVTNGGRVLTITALGRNVEEARTKVYNNIERIHFEGMHYRRDIGANASSAALAGGRPG